MTQPRIETTNPSSNAGSSEHAGSHADLPSLSDRPGNRLVGKAQLVAGAPFRADIVDQDGLADALDGALGESVPRVGAGNEHHAGIEDTGGTAHQVLLSVQQIRPPFLRAAFLREIDLQGQLLDTDVGVRPEPEAFTVLTILNPQ